MQWTDLCNRALSRLGTNLIASFSDGSNNAQYCLLHYEAVLGSLLSKADWTWAKARAELAQVVAAPVFGNAYAYPLPPDFVRFFHVVDENGVSRPEVETDGSTWAVETLGGARVIATDSGYLFLSYVATPATPALMTEAFAEAYVAHLAAELSIALARSESIHAQLLQEAMMKERSALMSDAELAMDAERTPWFWESR